MERRLPTRAERRNPEGAADPVSGVPGQVKKGIDLGDSHLLGAGGKLEDFVPRLDLALDKDAQVEPGAAM